MDIIVLGFGYYLIKFYNDSNKEKVLLEGPVKGHYLTI